MAGVADQASDDEGGQTEGWRQWLRPGRERNALAILLVVTMGSAATGAVAVFCYSTELLRRLGLSDRSARLVSLPFPQFQTMTKVVVVC